ncbi:hypothetical protein SAMN06265370_104177 [Puniceibacterium sediminis]|uniref:Uncharacterized protein n=1 Tax=Puniceibacterium sediminis TaxID=1608407 RepID=A0A238W872_9RHOB|nr:hypothetical protein SAMN06265370_104177 [Puniceibacterium sediminis]
MRPVCGPSFLTWPAMPDASQDRARWAGETGLIPAIVCPREPAKCDGGVEWLRGEWRFCSQRNGHKRIRSRFQRRLASHCSVCSVCPCGLYSAPKGAA